ncbi:Wzz/FepE/Etk N-terminal domain-containing protein [Pedobacter sp. ASV28]|uniref:Wzz/FepE/Etk N-terminal domain-containing protein n=1 Tax=Pedobacter sp. ASV28 TaxID=2795123 RepID=UPI0018EDFDF5|nr:Wzz/FepE/Etk N-terminal domain-containing protein [Pedobacter sp. ASV28]
MKNDLDKLNDRKDDEISLKELILKIKEWWLYLWSKKWTIVIVCILGGALGLAYSFMKKPIYTATTTFVLESGEKGGGLGAYAGVASMMGIDLGGSGGGGIFQGDNILELYKSRTMIEKTLFSPVDSVTKQPLIEKYIEMNKLREGWEKKPELKSLHFSMVDLNKKIADPKVKRLRDSVISEIIGGIVKGNLSVAKPDKKLSIIKVDIRSGDEVFAKRFNEELVKNVNDFYVQTKTKKFLDNVQILQHKTDSVRAVMNGAIYSAVAVADATPNSNPTRQVQRAVPIQRAQFSAETNRAVLGEMVKNLEMSKMALMKEAPLIQVVDEPIFPLQKERLGKFKGIIIGGTLAMFISIIILLVRYFFKQILN